ncbi:hypothetical protein ACHQM5_028140 [Ranunculus cassubicifolius]
MADENSIGSESTSYSSAESSESTVSINVKTLESQVYSFQVNKNMSIPALKEKVASETGVPAEQQWLIFRGKVLKDDQMLSGYHVEDGDTFHLVVRPLVQSQTSTGPSSGEANRNTDNGGNDTGSGVPRGRVGVRCSVVVGSFNVGDQGGEGSGSDLSRIIGAVLNSFGIGNQNPIGGVNNVSSSIPSNASNQPSQGVGTRGSNGVQSQSGNQMPPGQASTNLPFQSMHQSLPFPLTGAAVVIPSPQMPIPDALHTLSEFINRMESALSATGYWPSPSPANMGDPEREDLPSHASGPSPSSTNEGDPPRQDLPSNARGLPTLESLSIILRRAEQLISGHALAALSHVAGRLEEEGGATDPTVRNQIQTEAVQVGLAMQHLGSLLLELGRTILTLRMGQSPAQSLVYPGPAVYISPSGPNPIMVQPFPLQTSSLFGGLASSQTIPGMMGAPIGYGDSHRNVNIHIYAIGSRGINGEHNNHQGPPNGPETGPANPVINDAFSLYGRALNIYQTRPSRFQNSGPVTSATVQPSLSDSSPESSIDSGSLPALVAQVNSLIRNFIDSHGENQVQSAVPMSNLLQQVLQSLVSHGANPNTRNANNSQAQAHQAQDPASGQIDAASMMSQVLNSPALNSLLTGMSQQASPNGLRNMLSQLTQNPAMLNTVNQIDQQIEGQDSGGFDLSRMVQQMMPIVSQALTGSGFVSAPTREPSYTPGPNREEPHSQQVDMFRQIIGRIERNDPPQEIFRNVLELAFSLVINGDFEDLQTERQNFVTLLSRLWRSTGESNHQCPIHW